MKVSESFKDYRRARLITGIVSVMVFCAHRWLYALGSRPWWELYQDVAANDGNVMDFSRGLVRQGRCQVGSVVLLFLSILILGLCHILKRSYKAELIRVIASAPTKGEVDEAGIYAQLAEEVFYQLDIDDPRRVKVMAMSEYFHQIAGIRLRGCWEAEYAAQDLARLKRWLP